MSIDVFTTSLANQLRNVSRRSAIALARGERHPITREGLAAAAAGRDSGASFIRAYMVARSVSSSLDVEAGSPFAPLGPCMAMEPDQLDSKAWLQLCAELGRVRDLDPELSVWDSEWNDQPGLPFVRAVDRAQCLVVPAANVTSFLAGGLAVVSTRDAYPFFDQVCSVLDVPRSSLEEDYDPDLPDDLNRLLYNPRILAFHVSGVEESGRPMGVWG